MKIRNLTLADEELKKAVVDGKFVIDCSEIILTQNTLVSPRKYVSSGYLLVDAKEGISARIVSNQVVSPLEPLMLLSQARSGEIIPNSHYFTIHATDVMGNVWRNPTAQVKVSPHRANTVISIACDYIRCEFADAPSTSTWTHIIFWEDLDFPMNVNQEVKVPIRDKTQTELIPSVSCGVAGGMTITYRNSTNTSKYSEIFATAETDATLPDAFQHRLLESVRFVTATAVSWAMCETVQNGTRTLELSTGRSANKGMLPEPLDSRRQVEDFYGLLDAYFRYTVESTTGENFSRLSSKVAGLYSVKGVWLDSIALMLGVAVESVLNEFPDLAKPDKSLTSEVDAISKAIADLEVTENTIKRAIGSLSGMKSSRALDKLKYLAGIGAITEHEISQWKNLRNSTAHGSLHVDPEKLQKLLNDVYGAMTLVYKLVFLRIKYDGKYSDYSEVGWEVKEFKASLFQSALLPSTSQVSGASAPLETPS